MGGQRAEDERDGAGVGLDEADALRGGRFVEDAVSGGGVAGGVGGGVGARTAERTGTATEAATAIGTVTATGVEDEAGIGAGTRAGAGFGVGAEAAAADLMPADLEPADLTDSQIVGRRLSLARQHAGLSIEEVVAATRIRPGMLREIEAGEFVHCGGDVYARGHVRAIAKVVGVDPEPLLAEHPPFVPTDLPVRGRSRVVPRAEVAKDSAAPSGDRTPGAEKRTSAPASNAVPTSAVRDSAAQFNAARDSAAQSNAVQSNAARTNAARDSAARDNAARSAGRAPSRVIRPAAEGATLVAVGRAADAGKPAVVAGRGGGSGPVRPPQRSGKIERHPKSANWTAAMLVALLGLVVFAGVQLVGDDNSKTATAAAAPAAPASKPAPAKPAPAPAPPAPKGVAVRIAAVGSDSWLDVTGPDGRVLFDSLLPAGSTQSFQDPKQLGVTLGNAAAVHMTLNGKDLGPAGGSGQVVHVTLNPTGAVNG